MKSYHPLAGWLVLEVGSVADEWTWYVKEDPIGWLTEVLLCLPDWDSSLIHRK